jgi:ligand-binding sensor domain-containing protein
MRKLTSLLITALVMGSFTFSRAHVSNAKPPVPGGLKNPYVTSLVMDSQKNLYAGTFGGVFRTPTLSSGSTAAWVDFNGGLQGIAPTLDVRALAVSENFIYAGTWGRGVFQSSFGNANWGPIGGISGTGELGDLHVQSLKLDSVGNLWATTPNGIFRRNLKTDSKWTNASKGLNNLNVKSLALDSQGYAYAATWGSGVFKSTGGSQWAPYNTGLNGSHVFHVTTDAPGTYIYASTQTGVYRIASSSKSWIPYNTGLTDLSVKAIAVDSMGNLFGATTGGVIRSGIPTSNWTIYHPEIMNPDVNTLFIDSLGNLYAGTSGSGVFKIPLASWMVFS